MVIYIYYEETPVFHDFSMVFSVFSGNGNFIYFIHNWAAPKHFCSTSALQLSPCLLQLTFKVRTQLNGHRHASIAFTLSENRSQ